MNLTDLLTHMTRPPGGGIHTVSAGAGAAYEIQRQIYSVLSPSKPNIDEALIQKMWKQSWFEIGKAKVILLGVPSDTGAGIRRGAAYGPRAVREMLLKSEQYCDWLRSRALIDLGDIYINPHLLHDDMLSDQQIQNCRDEMYGAASPTLRNQFSVSVLSQMKQVMAYLLKEFAHLKFAIIGGDHSIAWPVTEVMHERYGRTLGIVQPDAHTDMLPSRLGVKYCFGTWSFHANDLLGRDGKLVQLGIRQSARSRDHWENTYGVKQYWAEEILSRSEDEVIAELVAHLKSKGVKSVYFSNDIDGTDESEASATGTPAAFGLSSSFLLKVIDALGSHFALVASDISEVAPDLAKSEAERVKTCKLAADYMMACLKHQMKRG